MPAILFVSRFVALLRRIDTLAQHVARVAGCLLGIVLAHRRVFAEHDELRRCVGRINA